MALNFENVVEAWNEAGEEHIHPLWGESEDDYWASGRHQAGQVLQYADPGATVIDFGCGNGRLTIPLIQAGYNVIAVDASDVMLQRLKTHAAREGIEEVNTIQSDGSNLATKLGKKKADVIVARAVLIHHDYAGVEKIVTGISAALKKGGHFMADWPVGEVYERETWISVTTWDPHHRMAVATKAGLTPVQLTTDPTVWRKG